MKVTPQSIWIHCRKKIIFKFAKLLTSTVFLYGVGVRNQTVHTTIYIDKHTLKTKPESKEESRGSQGVMTPSCPVPVHKVVSRMNDVRCVSGEMASHRFVLFARSYL